MGRTWYAWWRSAGLAVGESCTQIAARSVSSVAAMAKHSEKKKEKEREIYDEKEVDRSPSEAPRDVRGARAMAGAEPVLPGENQEPSCGKVASAAPRVCSVRPSQPPQRLPRARGKQDVALVVTVTGALGLGRGAE